MIRRLIPLALFVFIASIAFTQIPKSIDIGFDPSNQNTSFTLACPPGASPDGGTATQTLFPSAQSDNVLFLCLGDSMEIQHFGGDLSGDPQPATAPGFSYVFYNCPPTATGPTAADILADNCHIEINAGMVTAVQNDIDINGNATFFNNGLIQSIISAGAPTTIWFAPITLDNFAGFGFEQDGSGVVGPCINVNTNAAFTVTYLNEITAANINPSANGNCVGSFNIGGGLPELDGSNYSDISITLNSDPTVEADISGANFTHGDLIEFTVPRSGVYTVTVEDGVSCGASFTIDMTACQDIIFDVSEEFGNPGSTVCVQVDVNNFNAVLSFQFTMNWDPTVLQLPTPISSSVNNLGALADIQFGPANPTDALTVSWFDASFAGQSLPNGTGIFEICFEIIGMPGSSSPITFSSDLTQIEVLGPDPGGDFPPLGFNGIDGSVTVAGDITLTFTSCSSPLGGPDAGTFTITTTGGIPPYTYTWVNTADATIFGSGTISMDGDSDVVGDNMPVGDGPLPPGTYEVTLTDNNGDMQVANVEIFDANPLIVGIAATPPSCFDVMDGTMEITNPGSLGGIGPYTYVWSNMETGVTMIDNLGNDQYFVTVTDAAGCSEVAGTGISTPEIIIDTINLQHVSCNGPGNDGAIIILASGGVPPPGGNYDYAWDNAMVGPNISGLTPGTYCVTVTDGNNCQLVHCIDINAPMPPVIINWDSTSVSCPTDMNGSLTVNAVAGNAPIDSYNWDPVQPGADETISGIGPGTYYVTITATDGCITIDSAMLFAPQPLVFDSSQTSIPNCPGDVNGSVTVFISGGTAPYDYVWSNGTSSDFPLLPNLVGDSTYTVTVTDSGNCGDTVIANIFLANPPDIDVVLTNPVDATCNGGIPCDGQLTALASGGTAGTGMYNFNWESGESFSGVSQSTAMQLCEGFITLEVNDGLCSVTIDSISVGAPAPIEIDGASSSTPASCFGAMDGGATIVVTGGSPGYTYQWTNPNVSGQTIENLPAGIYTGIATDANGCTFQYSAEISEPDLLVATITGQMDANCSGGADGMLEVSWEGGNPGLATYSWTNNVSNTSVANNLPAGTYTVTVTDQNGCNDIATGVVNEPTPIFFALDTIVEPLCFGFQTFISIDTAFGGDGPPYSFSVDNGPIFPITSGSIPVLAGQHTIMVFDASPGFQCSAELDTFINQPSPVNVNLGPDVEIELGDSIELDAQIQSFLAVDSILWFASPINGTLLCQDSVCDEVLVMPLETTLYSVVVSDVNGCTGTDEIQVEVDKNRNIFIPNVFTPDADGFNDVFSVYSGVGVENINFMRIFDRWGEQVYEGLDLPVGDFTNAGWDGRFNGKVMNPGVFIYLIEVEFTDGVTLLYRGDLTLLH